MDARRKLSLMTAFAGLAVASLSAQPRRQPATGGGGEDQWNGGSSIVRMEDGTFVDEATIRTPREATSHSTGTPDWTNPPGFEKDVFTFARVLFKSAARPGENTNFGYGRGPNLGWWVDFPDADLNFSYRLQQMTSIRTNPEGRVVRLTDPDLTDFPFIYMEHCGYIKLKEAEVTALASYLRNGGVLLVIDFWSTRDWDGFAEQMSKVLPGKTWTDLDVDHPLFHCVYNIEGPMKRLQVPTMQFWNSNFDLNDPTSRLQRVPRGEGSETMHVRALLDDKQRISVLAFHNTDISDGWEREGENRDYFLKFSEKIAYPLGINIIFYLMTH